MATTGLASSAASKFDAVTPPKPSSLPSDIVSKLLVNLDDQISQLKSGKSKLDIEGLINFQRVANYL
jgi:xylulose-5-phosphate/fructose-6-phosphate phosphoketolase